MTIDKIIRFLERALRSKNLLEDKEFLVVRKNIVPKKIKSYKEVSISLWLVDNKKETTKKISEITNTKRIINDEEKDWAMEEIEYLFMEKIFSLLHGDKVKEHLHGNE